jgi:CheY-like chemotaxis protein
MNSPDGNSKPANSRTVLVLDDDVLVRMPVVQFLRDCGHRVVEAATIDEAIALLEKTNIPLDLVLSKIDIPRINERLRVRAMGPLSSTRIENTACGNARAHGPQCR